MRQDRPYQEYLAHIEQHPQDERKPQEMRVLIDEPALVSDFKYVSEQIDDDHCLALLYKLKRAFSLVEEQAIVDSSDALAKLDEYIEEIWRHRGLYPGLGSVVSVLADLAEGKPQKETDRGQTLVDALRMRIGEENDLLAATFALLELNAAPTGEMQKHGRTLREARAGLRDHRALMLVLKKLLDAERSADLDREQRTDGAIDYFTVDIGMFPDSRMRTAMMSLRILPLPVPNDFARFRSRRYAATRAWGTVLRRSLCFSKRHPPTRSSTATKIALRADQFLSPEALKHFAHCIYVKEVDGEQFFYLHESKQAEEIVNRYVTECLAAPDRRVDVAWIAAHLDAEASQLADRIERFDTASFKAERRRS